MLETIAVFVIGLIPGFLSFYLVTTRVRRYGQRSRHPYPYQPLPTVRLLQPHLQAQDYHYVEGLGYMVGDLSCQFNARSPYLRCAINPSGPCDGCPSYEAIRFPEELDDHYPGSRPASPYSSQDF